MNRPPATQYGGLEPLEPAYSSHGKPGGCGSRGHELWVQVRTVTLPAGGYFERDWFTGLSLSQFLRCQHWR